MAARCAKFFKQRAKTKMPPDSSEGTLAYFFILIYRLLLLTTVVVLVARPWCVRTVVVLRATR